MRHVALFLLLFVHCGLNSACASEQDSTQALAKLVEGQDLFYEDQIDSALQRFTVAAEMYETLDLKDDLANTYLWISACHYERSDCDKDQLFAERALDLKKVIYGESSTEVAAIMHDLGLSYLGCQRETRGFENLKAAKQIFADAGAEFRDELASTNSSIGWRYGINQQYDSAFVYLLETFEVRKELLGYWNDKVASSAHMIGYFSIYDGRFEQADKFVRIGLEIRQRVLGPHHHETIQSWQKMGECQLYQGNYSESLPYFQEALAAISRKPELTEDVSLNPQLDQVKNIAILPALLDMKATALHYMAIAEPKDTASLNLALATNDLALEASDRLVNYYTTRSSKASALSRKTQSVARAMMIEDALFKMDGDHKHIERIHSLMERSRNSLLRLAIHDDAAAVSGGVPKEMIHELDSLTTSMSKVDYALSLLEESDSTAIEKRKEKLDLQTELAVLLKEVETDYPDYHTLKYSDEISTTEQAQQQLDTGQLMISFHESKRWLVSLAMTADSMWVNAKKKPEGFDQLVTDFSTSLSDVSNFQNTPTETVKSFSKNGHRLYEILLRPVFDPDSTGKIPAELIIIPSGTLSYLPYETFVVTSDSTASGFSNLDYLIKHCNVHYAYSADPEFNQRSETLVPEFDVVSFVPDYNHASSELDPLVGAELEAESIEKVFGGLRFSGTDANRAAFFDFGPRARIIHMAMHTEVFDERPLESHFAFDGTEDLSHHLQARELFDLQLTAELVVLSGCQTGGGRLSRGEGVLSLSRAFTYAGCPSIVMTLWMTDDNANHQIVDGFYRRLKDGMRRDEALWKSKLEYLNSADAITSHPSYWAPFVLIGEDTPLDFADASKDRKWMIIAGIALLIFVISVIRRFLANR